jgi:hypothetical protein
MVPQPTVLKIDIEGMEYSALCGTSRVIEDLRLIHVKIHPKKLELRSDSRSDGGTAPELRVRVCCAAIRWRESNRRGMRTE